MEVCSLRSAVPLPKGCHLEGQIQLEGENILTGILKGAGDIKLQKGICVTCVPVCPESGWVSIIYGIDDDFKTLIEEEYSSFLNDAFLGWMEYKGISPTDLWKDNEPHELWNARLFPVSNELSQAIQISLGLQEGINLEQWKSSVRMSLQVILQTVDYERLLESYLEIDRKTKMRRIKKTLTPDSNLSSEEIMSWCHEQEDYETLIESVTDL